MEQDKRIERMTARQSVVKDLHEKGLTNRQIAKVVKTHHNTTARDLEALHLSPNGTTRGVLLQKDGKGKCTKCDTWKDINKFPVQRRGQPYAYRLTFCNECRVKQYNVWCNNNVKSFWNRRFYGWKKRAERNNIVWNLTLLYLKDIFDKQDGKCFYTDIILSMKVGDGQLDNSMSLDKIIPGNGYVPGNVVFCTRRFNTVKSNLTLDEMKKWMPPMYRRIKKKLSL